MFGRKAAPTVAEIVAPLQGIVDRLLSHAGAMSEVARVKELEAQQLLNEVGEAEVESDRALIAAKNIRALLGEGDDTPATIPVFGFAEAAE